MFTDACHRYFSRPFACLIARGLPDRGLLPHSLPISLVNSVNSTLTEGASESGKDMSTSWVPPDSEGW